MSTTGTFKLITVSEDNEYNRHMQAIATVFEGSEYNRHIQVDHCHLSAGVKLQKVAEPSGEAYSHAVSVLLPYLLSHRSRLAAFTAATAAASQATANKAPATTRSPTATGEHQAPSRSEFDPASEADAPAGSYSEALQDEGEPGSPMRSPPQEFLAGLQPEQRHRLAVLVDTAILKVCNVTHLFLSSSLCICRVVNIENVSKTTQFETQAVVHHSQPAIVMFQLMSDSSCWCLSMRVSGLLNFWSCLGPGPGPPC